MEDSASPASKMDWRNVSAGEVRISSLLTDLYQITMAYSYWKAGKADEVAVYDLYFRRNPFGGEFTIFAGLKACIEFLEDFQFTESDIKYLQEALPMIRDPEFFDYLRKLNLAGLNVYAMKEGSVCFPHVPLMVIEGPILVAQILETALLSLVNFASLVATNAARLRLAAGEIAVLVDMGLRRAQGPDGALSASRYSYLGGFNGTSNVLAGKLYGIPVFGTMAHSLISSHLASDTCPCMLENRNSPDRTTLSLLPVAEDYLVELSSVLGFSLDQPHKGELRAFVSYACSFPDHFLALVDTYNTIQSGLPNFLAVAMALHYFGYKAKGIRIDSGDLVYLSNTSQLMMRLVAKHYSLEHFNELLIVVSNDLTEDGIMSLRNQTSAITTYGVGSYLVTCPKQPTLGCVYKLVQLSGIPRMKISETVEKISIPCKKSAYRLFGQDGKALVDLVMGENEQSPSPGVRVLCRHPFLEAKRAHVTPSSVLSLHSLVFSDGKAVQALPSLEETRTFVQQSLKTTRSDHLRLIGPTPYKVSLSNQLYIAVHTSWLEMAPVGDLW